MTGPPCSGKSTYIRENAKEGDIIIDMDRIALAITTEGTENFRYPEYVREVARTARNAASRAALKIAKYNHFGLWIIHTEPPPNALAAYISAGARIVEMKTTKEVCIERLKSRPPEIHERYRNVINEYFTRDRGKSLEDDAAKDSHAQNS